MALLQPTLFATETPSFDGHPKLEATELADGAWFAYAPCWLSGDQEVFDAVHDTAKWRSQNRPMYDRIVEVPRLNASLSRQGGGHPILPEIADWLEGRYGSPFSKLTANWYRDGRDSVAPHGDQIVRKLDTSIMAILSLGARRRFVLSQVAGPGSVRLDVGEGDLLVMGGTIQRTWRHAVPKTAKPVGPRICVMFRPPWLG
ncbi:MAG TPA: alpha-ketoglutarate-dependent dioxygenase AlkB [Acidimicrobiales bacterium]|nr:alpha-ketoglutarate-dependent dioxygenase AlkB [Acidimicrobiales bacterium]